MWFGHVGCQLVNSHEHCCAGMVQNWQIPKLSFEENLNVYHVMLKFYTINFFFTPLTLQHPSRNIKACGVPVYMSTVQKCNLLFPYRLNCFKDGLDLRVAWISSGSACTSTVQPSCKLLTI